MLFLCIYWSVRVTQTAASMTEDCQSPNVFPSPHILPQQHNPQMNLSASFNLLSVCLFPYFWTPISSSQGFVEGQTSSLRSCTASVGLSTALFQTRHPLNRGITVIQPLYNSISSLSSSVSLIQAAYQRSGVINTDSVVYNISFLCISD